MKESLFSVVDFKVTADGEYNVIDLKETKNIQIRFMVIPRNILYKKNNLKDYSLVIDLIETISETTLREQRSYHVGLLSYESDFNEADNSNGVYEMKVDISVEEIVEKIKDNEKLDLTEGRDYIPKVDVVLRSIVDKKDSNDLKKDMIVYFNLPLSTDSGCTHE